jgi:hypothetical protein
MRGGAKKTWKMRTSDTLSFKLIVGRDFKDGAVPAVGTGLFYDESALTAWLPPLEMVCTRVPLVGGGAREQCVLQICQMSSGREHPPNMREHPPNSDSGSRSNRRCNRAMVAPGNPKAIRKRVPLSSVIKRWTVTDVMGWEGT